MAKILVKNFTQISKADTEIAGGKGASLGEMTQAEIPVPEGFVILSNAFERFIEETDLNVEIDAVLDTADIKEVHTIENASEKIQAMILSKEIPKDIKTEILNYYKNLDCKFVAVRSSATSEDSASAAWAGQLDSFLNTTEDTLLENIKKCWASLFTPRAIFYRFEKKLSKDKISVAVVVQKMVDSEESGIAFSVHPVTQNENQIIIEAGFGLGEAIVSGSITPDSYVLDKQGFSILDININEQTKALYKKAKGGNEWKELGEKGKKQVLTEKEIAELSKLIVKIENHYGFPCDIEWAREKGKFYIVQSRPITTLTKEKVNIIKQPEFFILEEIPEVFPTPVYDFMEIKHTNKFLQKMLKTKNKFHETLTTYENTNCNLCLRDDDFVGLSKDVVNYYLYKPKEASNLNKLIIDESVKFFAYSENLLKKIQKTEKVNELFNLWFDSYEHYAELHKFGWIHTLIDFKDNLFSKHLMEYLANKIGVKKISLNQAFVILTTPTDKKTHFAKESRDFLQIIKEVRKKGYKTKKEIEEDNSINNLLKEHTQKYCWVGFGFIGPAWDKNHFTDTLIDNLDKTETQDITNKKQKELIYSLNIDKQYQLLFQSARELVKGKEFRKESMVFYYYVLDKLLSKLSDLSGVKKEILRFIYPTEIPKINLTQDCIEELKKRTKFHLNYISEKKDVVLSGDKAKEYFKRFKFIELDISGDTLSGSIAYPGYAKGKAKIINVKNDIAKIKEGEILISIATNPDLVPAMKKASAIVTDVGGITSHAAIVARELKIPCVIGTSVATKIIKDGDMIEVDAEKGVVKILK